MNLRYFYTLILSLLVFVLAAQDLEVEGSAKIDGSTFNVDKVNDRVGIGIELPLFRLHIKSDFSHIGLDGQEPIISFIDSTIDKAWIDHVGSKFRIVNKAQGPLVFATATAMRMTIDSIGRVGINTTTPKSILEVRPQFYAGNGGVAIEDLSGDRWSLNTFSAIDPDLGFFYNGLSMGYLSSTTNVNQIDFTSQHRTLPSSNNVIHFEDKIGMIVSSDGTVYNLDGSTLPSISESLPKVKITDKAYDKSIYGVIAGIEEKDEKGLDNKRTYTLGIIATTVDRVDENDYRLIINSGGEGGIWVSNYNGDIENGDLIVSSPIAGIGMKQENDVLHSYTVAKVVMNCEFDLNSPNYDCRELIHDGKTYKMAFLACVYKCD